MGLFDDVDEEEAKFVGPQDPRDVEEIPKDCASTDALRARAHAHPAKPATGPRAVGLAIISYYDENDGTMTVGDAKAIVKRMTGNPNPTPDQIKKYIWQVGDRWPRPIDSNPNSMLVIDCAEPEKDSMMPWESGPNFTPDSSASAGCPHCNARMSASS